MIPFRGSRGPGLLMPIAATDARRFGSLSNAAAMARSTASNPSASLPPLDMGMRTFDRISPRGVTNPAATFVPPMSIPR